MSEEEAWWKGWAVPIATLDERALLLRVVNDLPDHGIWPSIRYAMNLNLWRKNTDALFLYYVPGPQGTLLGFQFDILPIAGGVYIDKLYTPFQYNPLSGNPLRRAMFWVLFDMLGIEKPWAIEPPRGIAPTPQAELFLPRPSYNSPLTLAEEDSDWIASLRSLSEVIEPTNLLLRRLVDTGFISQYDPDHHDHELDATWFVWRIYLGGPKQVDLMVDFEDEEGTWCIQSPDGLTITSDFASPLDAMQALPLWWPRDDPEGYIDRYTAHGVWCPEVHTVLEPYLLLGEMPLAWPLDRFRTWASEVGLL